MARNYTALPHEYMATLEKLTDEEFGRLIRGLLSYSMTGEVVDLPGPETYVLPFLITRENQFQAQFEHTDKIKSQRARKGAEARWGKKDIPTEESIPGDAQGCLSMLEDASDANSNTNSTYNTNTNTNSNTNYNPTSNAMAAEPEVEDVREYCERRGYGLVDAEDFVSYYRARDWMVGAAPMRDWRAMADAWEKKAREKAPPEPSPSRNAARALEQMERLERLRREMTGAAAM